MALGLVCAPDRSASAQAVLGSYERSDDRYETHMAMFSLPRCPLDFSGVS
jgi:hypothetical protein